MQSGRKKTVMFFCSSALFTRKLLQLERYRQEEACSHRLSVLLPRCPFRHSADYAECFFGKQPQHFVGGRFAIQQPGITVLPGLNTAQASVRVDDEIT